MKRLIFSSLAGLALFAGTAFPCGEERWPVKTLTDPGARSIRYRAIHPATVGFLGSLTVDRGGQATRSAIETRVYAVNATLVKAKAEGDGDIHLVLQDGSQPDLNSMIAEMPDLGCTRGAQQRFSMFVVRQRLTNLAGPIGSSWVTLNWKVHVAGVAFFDFAHGQTGHAPNYIELHPVIGFRKL